MAKGRVEGSWASVGQSAGRSVGKAIEETTSTPFVSLQVRHLTPLLGPFRPRKATSFVPYSWLLKLLFLSTFLMSRMRVKTLAQCEDASNNLV
jgi:hypothetical protein